MKQVSAEYKNQIKEMGREIDSIISYYNHYRIITEDNKYIITEDGKRIITEQINKDFTTNITAEDIYSSKVITHGQLLKTMMKEFDFEVKQNMKVGSIVNYKFGLKVNGSYEYVDYGDFIVHSKEYNEDTKTYSYVAYDKMLFTMIPYVAEDISERQEVYTLYDLVKYCCEFCDLELDVESFPNGEREITDDILKSLGESNFTFRDILDYATEVTGCSSYMIGDSFVIMPPQETQSDNYIINSQDFDSVTGFNTNISVLTDTYYNFCNVRYGNMTSYTTTTQKSFAEWGNVRRNFNVDFKAGDIFTFSFWAKGNVGTGSKLECFFYGNTNYARNRVITTSNNYHNQGYGDGNWRFTNLVTNEWQRFFVVWQINPEATEEQLAVAKHVLIRQWGNSELYVCGCQLEKGQTTGEYKPYGKLTLYADSFKDTNVKFNEVFGPINSILFSRSEDTDVIEIKDDESIEANGVTQIKIKDNPFLEGNDRADYFQEMFDVLNGLTYSLNDVSSIGITYLEFNDKYKVKIDENEYDCLLLNDEINVVQGLEETIFTEVPEERQEDYVTSTANIDDVSLRVDKANKQIVLKVDSEGKLATAELRQNADNGTEFNVKADNIKLEGYTTINGGFAVDLDGNMICNDATINGGNIDLYGPEQTAQFIIHSTDSNGYASLGSHEITMSNGEEHSNGFYASTYDTSGAMWYRFNNSYIQCTFLDDMPQYNDITLQCNGTSGYSTTYTSVSSFTLRPKEIYSDILETDGKFLLYIGHRKIIEASYTGVYLYNSSLEEYKKNIKMFNNALELIKNTDVYSFNYKEEADDYKPHIGVVIGKNRKTPTEMLNNDNDGADYNNMTSICIQAIKEQQEQIELLKQEIESLKERIGK